VPELPVSASRRASSSPLRAVLLAVLAVLAALTLTACGGSEGSRTNCDLSGCTVTFDRTSANPEVSVLGVTARLVGVEGGAATIDIAGNTVQLPVGAQTTAEGFNVGLERLTETEVVVRIQLNAGG
jgi:hypothetical protein